MFFQHQAELSPHNRELLHKNGNRQAKTFSSEQFKMSSLSQDKVFVQRISYALSSYQEL